jgi:DNA polymerase-3 subunit alpha
VLLCVQSGSRLDDPKRFKFDGDGYYLKSPAEMRHVFRELPEACDNTLLIAERCDVSFTEGEGRYMPRFPCPPARTRPPGSSRRSSRACRSGTPRASRTRCARRPSTRPRSSSPRATPGYFLVVADFIGWAKDNGIRVGPGRGSGPGSMCAYAMGITDLDPLQHGLIFERFLNPERMSMPDFDIDFDERRRSRSSAT